MHKSEALNTGWRYAPAYVETRRIIGSDQYEVGTWRGD
jgi:hypothetical protein